MSDGDSLFVGLLCASLACVLVILVDGWFLRPKRDPGATGINEPPLPRLAGYALIALALAMLWRLFRYEAVDFSLMLVVDDIDTAYSKAVDAGCTATMPPADMFWGDRYGQLKDPFGVTWAMNQHPK